MNISFILVFLVKSLIGYKIIEAQSLTGIKGVPNVIESTRRLESYDVSALQIRQTTSEATPAGNNLNVEASSVEKKPVNLGDFAIRRDENAKIGEDEIETRNEIVYADDAVNANRGLRRPPKLISYDYCPYAKNHVRETFDDNSVSGRNHYSDGLIKRHATNENASSKRKIVFKSDDDAAQAKAEKRKQFKVAGIVDVISQKEKVPIIPITTEIFGAATRDPNVNVDWTLTEKPDNAEDIWHGRRHESDIRFNELPQNEVYLIPTLKLEEGFYPFRFMTEFFKHIYPFDFPVALIKDVVWGEFSFPYSFIQSIKVESTFLASVIIFVCMALIIPAYLLCLAVMALLAKTENGEDAEAGALFPEERRPDCKSRFNLAMMSFVILFCCGCIAGMTTSNEQASEVVHASRTVARCACSDLGNWITAAARDIYESLLPPIDLVTEAYREDLKNVVLLLGEPVQKAISSESGIDLVLDSLNDITSESEDLSIKISALRDTSVRGGALASQVITRLKDLAHQLDNLKKQCGGRDLPLCDTINTHSLELLIKFDAILHEHNLLEFRSLGVDNLTSAIVSARTVFASVPSVITKQTAVVRGGILQDVESRRQETHKLARILSDIVRYLTASLRIASRSFESLLQRLQHYDNWRWSIMLGCNVMCCIVMLLMISGLTCGCGNAKKHAMRTLKVSAIWIFLASLVVWALIAATYLIAGHAEVYICQALWDAPGYHTLSSLLDRPSPLSSEGDGIFDFLFKELENVTVDISVSEVLRDCEKDQPAYNVFQLEKVLDVNKATSYFEWEELQRDLSRMHAVVDVGFLKTITSNLSMILQDMQKTSDIDLVRHRLELNGAMVGRDLPSLVEQMQTVASQLTDLTTASRLETLASRTQRLHLTSVKPLEELRADIVYKLTELELQLGPFKRKLNISLSHIHTAQYYIDNQGDVIAQKKVAVYTGRLVSHVAGWRTHALKAVSSRAAHCHPLFAVFSGARSLLCTRYISSLHGWWLCAFILAVLWCVSTPLCVWFWRSYAQIRADDALLMSNISSGQQDTPTTIMCEASNWNSPGPPQNDSW